MSDKHLCDNYGIFWDIENCPLTRHMNISTIVKAIRLFVASKCRNANTTECIFQCACDVRKIDDRVGDRIVDVLNKNGIDILHITSRGKVNADSKLIENIQKHAEHHSSDSTLVVITGDSDFGATLRAIQRKRMNLILIYGQNASQDLRNILKEDQCFFFDKIIMDYEKRGERGLMTEQRSSFGFPAHQSWTVSAPSATTPAHHSFGGATPTQPQFDHTSFQNYVAQLRQNVSTPNPPSTQRHSSACSTTSNSKPEESIQLIHLDDDWGGAAVSSSNAAQKTLSATQTSVRKSQSASNQAFDKGFSQLLEESQKEFISSPNASQTPQSQATADTNARPSTQTPTPTPNNTPQKQQLKTTLTPIANVYEKQLLQVLDFLPSSDTKEVLDLLYKSRGDVYAVIDALLAKQHS